MALRDLIVGFRDKVQSAVGGVPSGKANFKFPLEDQDDYIGKITFIAKRENYRSLSEAGIDIVNNARSDIEQATGGVLAGGAGNNESERANTEFSATASGDQGDGLRGGPAVGSTVYDDTLGYVKIHNEAPPTSSSTVTSGSAAKPSKTTSSATSVAAKANKADKESFEGRNPALSTYSTFKPTYTTTGQVQMYLPASLQFQDGVEYANTDLGVKGTATAGVLRMGDGVTAAAMEGIKKLFDFEGMKNLVMKGMSDKGAQVLALRMASFSPEIQGAVETETGVTLNPNRRSALRGVSVRSFRFTFKLLPTSPAEAREITNIINFFRKEMYPETSHLNLVLNYPSKFEIKMQYGGKNVATKILPCFLNNVDVVYNPNSMAFHEDGEFQETDITLTFIEERALTKDDIKRGY
jgi:hypothetical protein